MGQIFRQCNFDCKYLVQNYNNSKTSKVSSCLVEENQNIPFPSEFEESSSSVASGWSSIRKSESSELSSKSSKFIIA